MSDQVPSIYETGTLEHVRYLIIDPEDRFWTGGDWSDKESEGRLFVSINDASEVIQEILRAKYSVKPVRRYVAPVFIDIFSEHELTLEAITDWLVKNSRLITNENGPLDGTLCLGRIEWSELKEIKTED